jgi:RNA polymerase sigma-70 factor (ECF subfamily)
MKIEQEHILDELLVMRTQNGDMKAFSLLVKRWQPALLSQAYRLTRDNEAALDVAQETWKAIANGIYKLKSPAAFKTWSFRIVSNKSVNWIKELQKQRALKLESDEFVMQEAQSDESENVELIKRALNELPVKSKTILSMFYIDNHTVKEISQILSLSAGTVKSRLFYARKMLKEKFETFKQ